MLEIADRSGKILRRFSSDDPLPPFDEKELRVPTYWVRPPRALSNGAGMHRFVWDLHLPSPPALEADYPIAAIPHDTPRTPLGPAVVPGEYNVKLTVNGKSDSRMLVVRMDPRVSVTPAALQQQFDVELQIGDALRQDFAALQQLRRLRAQIKDLRDRGGQSSATAALAAFDQKLAALEGKTDSSFLPEDRGSLARVNSALNSLLGTVDSADAAPTAVAISSFVDVQQWLKAALDNWSAIKQRDLPQLNQTLQQAGLSALAVPE